MNNESFDALLKRLNNQEKQQVIEYAYMFDDLRYLREHDRYLKKQLETYKNVIKEAIDKLNNWDEEKSEAIDDYYLKDELLNILNKVGGSDE